jgi:hypothetical protein
MERLQRFLSIADTIHDFGDMGRYPVVESTDTVDKRRELKERIIASLVEEITQAMVDEYLEVQLHPENKSARELAEAYRGAFRGGMNVPKGIGDEDRICEIIKMSLATFGPDYFGEGNHYVRYEFDREETTPEHLYGYLSDLSGKRFVKYVLDANQADNSLFCVDPHIIKITTNVNVIANYPAVKAFVFKSVYKGLFHDFDTHRNIISNKANQNNTIKSRTDCCHNDYVEYLVQKTTNELLELTEIGVKRSKGKHRIVYSYGTEHDIPIVFKEKQSHKGLSLFNRAIIEMGTATDLTTLQNTALQVIDDVFSLRCDRYADIYQSSSDHRFASVRWTEPTRFPKALYDIKRGMDYLPVKAAKNANIAFSQQDIQYFYVSSDRLAIAYAILQGCPCVLVEKGGCVFHIYNPRGQVMLGGRKAVPMRPDLKELLYPSSPPAGRTERDSESYNEYMQLHIDHLLPDGDPETEFDAFLMRYKTTFNEQEINYFWYAVYRFLFFFL